MGQPFIDHQSVAVLYQRMAHMAGNRRRMLRLVVNARIGDGGADVGGIGPLLAVEVDFWIGFAPGLLWRRPILGHKAFMRSPRLDERPIDGEVFIREKSLGLRLGQHFGKQHLRRILLNQPITILRERRVIPHPVVDRESDEPAYRAGCTPTARPSSVRCAAHGALAVSARASASPARSIRGRMPSTSL